MTEAHWELYLQIRVLLQLSFTTTLFFSGVYYPTCNGALNSLFEISLPLKKYRDHDLLNDICKKMEENFNKYWKDTPMIFCLAAALDPRLKSPGVQFFLKK